MPIVSQNRNAVLGRIALLATTLIWGTSFVVLKKTLDEVPALYVLAIRFTGAALLMMLISVKELKKLDKKLIKSGIVLGILLFAGYTFQTYGLYHTTPSKNAFLTSTFCIIVPFVLWFTEKKRPDKYNIYAAFMCLVGVGFVSLKSDFTIEFGDFLTICCGFFYAIHIIMTSKYVKGRSIAMLTMIQFATVGLLSWAFAIMTNPFPKEISAENLWGIVYLCVMCTAVCFVLQTYGQKHTPPSTVAIVMTLESVFGAAFSVMFKQEVLTVRLICGFALIFFAMLICETKLNFLKRRKVNEKYRFKKSKHSLLK